MMNNKRWAVMRKATGKVVRSFVSREAARGFKRVASGNVVIYDTVNSKVVR